MKRRTFYYPELYLQYGWAMLKEGSANEAKGCAYTILKDDPNQPDARKLLAAAKQLERQHRGKANSEETPRLQKVRRLKAMLDEEILRAQILNFEPEQVPKPEVEEQPPVSEELRREVITLRRRLVDSQNHLAKKILEWVKILSDRLRIPSEQGLLDFENEMDFWNAISLEHQIHNTCNLLYKQGFFDLACDGYQLILKSNPDLLETHFNLSLTFVRLGLYEDALHQIETVITQDPTVKDAIYTKGLILEYMRRYDEAIKCYEQAVSLGYSKAAEQKKVAEEKRDKISKGYSNPVKNEDGITDYSSCIVRPDGKGFTEVGGCSEAVNVLRMCTAYLNGEPAMEKYGLPSPRGVLLYGPSGTGKTLLAQAVAAECGVTFLSVSAAECLSPWYSVSEKNLHNLTQFILKYPKIVFFVDEIDAIASRRADLRRLSGDECHSRTVTTFLTGLDTLANASNKICTLCCTNKPENLDPAVMRRFPYKLHVGLPGLEDRAAIWFIHLAKVAQRATKPDLFCSEIRDILLEDRAEWLRKAFSPCQQHVNAIIQLAEWSKGLSGADIKNIIDRTVLNSAMMELTMCDSGPITTADLHHATEDYIAQNQAAGFREAEQE